MSNDTNEPTGARLTEAQVKSLYFRLSHDENVEAGAAYSENRQLTLDDVRALLADRAARVAENADLREEVSGAWHAAETAQAEREGVIQAYRDLRNRLQTAETQNAEMRPLVEALVEWLDGDTVNVGWLHTTARALVATWQTPAAPTPDGREGDDDVDA